MARQAQRPATPATSADPTPKTEAPSNPSGRTPDGKFARGNRGGPGNPFAREVAELRCAFIGAATPEDLQQICRRLLTMAAMGDLAAAKLALGYILGRVPDPVNPDTLDQQECRQFKENMSCAELGEIVQHRPPADLAAGILRASEIANGERAHQVAQEIRADLAREAQEREEGSPDEDQECTEDLAPQEHPARAGAAAATEQRADTHRLQRRPRREHGPSTTVPTVDENPPAPEAAATVPSHNRPIGIASAGGTEAPPSTDGRNGRDSEPALAPVPSAIGSIGARNPRAS